MLWANGPEVLAAISPTCPDTTMADNSEDLPEEVPNLPLVPVRGVKDPDVWKFFDRYNIQFNPPTDTERKIVEVAIALEEALEESERTITRLRQRPSPSES
jgi:hypothetical protein